MFHQDTKLIKETYCSVHTLFKIKVNMMENINVFVLINKKPDLATIQNLLLSNSVSRRIKIPTSSIVDQIRVEFNQ